MLCGAAKAPQSVVKPSILGGIVLAIALVIGIRLVLRLRRDWYDEDDAPRSSDMLSDFEQAYAEGKMNEAEFRRIRDLVLGGKGQAATKSATKRRAGEQGRPTGTGSGTGTGAGQDVPRPAPTDVSLPPDEPE
jgi:hypothetical protein